MKILFLLLLCSSFPAFSQEISDADWLAYFAAPKKDKQWQVVMLGEKGRMISRYKGDVKENGQNWEKYVSVTDVGPVKNMQLNSLSRVDARGLIDLEEGKESIIIPRPLKIKQEWKKGRSTIIVVAITELETINVTVKDCLKIEEKEDGKVSRTKYYLKGHGLIHSESNQATISLIR